MSIKNLLKKTITLTGEFEFKNGFFLELEFVTKSELKKMLDKSKKTAWQRHQKTEGYDDELFAAQMVKKVKSWRGLTIGKLSDLVPIDMTGKDPEEDIPYNESDAFLLCGQVYGLAGWIQETITEVAEFRAKQQEKEVKNSKSTRAKSSA